jgi:uncharacterized protein
VADTTTKRPILGILLWLLTALFAARVAGQAIQRWAPIALLPPDHAFQGSSLPYPFLLSAQIVILVAMGYASWRASHGQLKPSRRWAVFLGAAGALYMTVALGRIAVGALAPTAPAWFRAWIPAFFHAVLASYVLALSAFHFGAQARERST